MSKYTTELRWICETSANPPVDDNGFNSIESILNNCRANIFNFEYPIFDEAYRPILEKKILRHFYTREICEETVGLWKLRLCDKMNIIMPYYNQLYSSTLLEYNPLYDVDYTKEGNQKENGTSVNNEKETSTRNTAANTHKQNNEVIAKDNSKDETSEISENNINSGRSNTTANNTNWDLYSDTPQGTVSNLNNETYLTNARKNTGNNDATTTDSNTNNRTGESSNAKTETETNSKANLSLESASKDDDYDKQGSKVGQSFNINNYSERVFGKTGSKSYSKLIEEFRKTFLNIDEMIINELNPLFFGLW